jgi:hypothetical protein
MAMSMDEAEQLSHVIEGIYDAAIDVDLWSGALKQACEFVGGCTANLVWRDTAKNALVFHTWGFEPRYQQMYFDTYAQFDPFYPASVFIEVGKVFSGEDIIPHEEFRKTRFYREWVRPQGYIDTIIVNLERSATAVSSFIVLRSEQQGVIDSDTRRRFALVAPHVRRALSIGKLLDFRKASSVALATTLDGLAAAVLLVGAGGHLVYANAKAHALLRSGNVLRAPNGHLTANDPAANRAIREAINAAADGDAGVGLKGWAVLRGAPAAIEFRGTTRGRRRTSGRRVVRRRDHVCVDNPAGACGQAVQADAERVEGAGGRHTDRR